VVELLLVVKHRSDKRQKIIINLINAFIRKKIVNFCKLKVNVHRA